MQVISALFVEQCYSSLPGHVLSGMLLTSYIYLFLFYFDSVLLFSRKEIDSDFSYIEIETDVGSKANVL